VYRSNIFHLRQIRGLINHFICLKNYSWVLMIAFFPNVDGENLFFSRNRSSAQNIYIYSFILICASQH